MIKFQSKTNCDDCSLLVLLLINIADFTICKKKQNRIELLPLGITKMSVFSKCAIW